ncbi:MAG TPA: tetraacyldisaccharide 4'-kinase [Marinilabiliaceae bacterium]|nr:tetraacyldisaccharide 4'-kinase [Marinilabiliaceae bacterium]
MFFRRLLFPFSWIYALVTVIRNKMFDTGRLPSKSYPIPVISVGNITVGGTGKTPLTEHLIRLLQPHHRIALLSRGYGRKTKGVIVANHTATYDSIGDEPMQMKQKFSNLMVAVAEKRTLGMDALLAQSSPPEIILMDDAYQHRYVEPGFSILVTDYHRPMWKDLCFPAGNLREPTSGIKRSQMVVVSKCPKSLSIDEAQMIQKRLKVSPHQKVFFSAIDYGEPKELNSSNSSKIFKDALDKSKHPLTVVAGIGNPTPFFKRAELFGVPIKTMRYKDHHDFSASDLMEMERSALKPDGTYGLILTTEKDAIRLAASEYLSKNLAQLIWYIPIQPQFLLDGEAAFNETILNSIKRT